MRLPTFFSFTVLLWLSAQLSLNGQHYATRNYSEEHGLTVPGVNVLYQDSRGVLWIGGSTGGLDQFTGLKFNHFNDLDNRRNLSILTLTEFEDRLIIGTRNNGLYELADHRLIKSTHEFQACSDGKVLAAAQRENDLLYLICGGKTLIRKSKNGSSDFQLPPKLSGDKIQKIKVIKEDRIVLSTKSELWVFNQEEFTKLDIPFEFTHGHVVDFTIDENSHIWTSTAAGVVKYDWNEFRQIELLKDRFIHGLIFDSENNLWASSPTEGLIIYKNQKVVPFENSKLNGNPAKALMQDYEGNVWVSTNRGVSMVREIAIQTYGSSEGVHQPIERITEDHDGNVILLGKSSFITIQEEQIIATPVELGDFHFSSFLDLGAKGAFLGTFESGLLLNATGEWQTVESNSFSSTGIYGLAQYKHSILAVTDEGIQSIHSDTTLDPILDSLRGQSPAIIFSDSRNRFWFDLGFLQNGRMFQLDSAIGVPTDFPISISEDTSTAIWHGFTSSGITRFDGEKLYHYGHIEGLSSDAVSAITVDHKNTVWVASDKGLDRVDIDIEGNISEVKKFGFNEGFSEITFNANSAFTDRDGNVWFGTIDGAIRFNPEEFGKAAEAPKISFDKVLMNELPMAEYPSEKGVTQFRFFQNNLVVKFTGIGFSNPRGLKFEYQLIQDGTPSKGTTTNDEIRISNLTPGSYQFVLTAYNSDGIPSKNPVKIQFRIAPPIWQTWWFRTISAVLVVVAVVLFIRIRNQRFKRQKQELEEKVEERTAELKAAQEKIIVQEKMASLGQLTSGIAHEIKNPLNFVNNFSVLSEELISEIETEIIQGKDEIKGEDLTELTEVLSDIKENTQKISEHGQRADDIVESMLEHSKGETGRPEPTDLSKLIDRSLGMVTHNFIDESNGFDPAIIKDFQVQHEVNVSPQDFQKVIINLLNNAFYALREKYESLKNLSGKQQKDWKPSINISTRNELEQVLITISDNGVGITEQHQKEVMNPFFTTKPTGKGNTGLGLSISYDIVVKQHEGNLSFSSKPGNSTEFVVSIPKNESLKG